MHPNPYQTPEHSGYTPPREDWPDWLVFSLFLPIGIVIGFVGLPIFTTCGIIEEASMLSNRYTKPVTFLIALACYTMANAIWLLVVIHITKDFQWKL